MVKHTIGVIPMCRWSGGSESAAAVTASMTSKQNAGQTNITTGRGAIRTVLLVVVPLSVAIPQRPYRNRVGREGRTRFGSRSTDW